MADAGGRDAAKPTSPVYLDYQATTPTDPRVVAAMLPYFTEKFANPHSREHAPGLESEAAVEDARARIATLVGADSKEIIFTSGATESNNLAIKGAAAFNRDRRGGARDHLVTIATEHKCVLETCRQLEREGLSVTYLAARPNGLIDLDHLRDAIGERTLLVSVMGVNNEIGVIQPLAEIGALCRARGVLFHSDCAQAIGKIPLDVNDMNIDLMSVSGHKLYGPMGIGVLYVRRRPRARLAPQIDGGGQERGLRSGTLPTPLCVGLGEACAIAGREMAVEDARIRDLRDRLHDGIAGRLDGVSLNGDLEHRLAGNLNLAFAGIDGESLLAAFDDLAVSSGSACTSASVEPSYVLRALGIDDALADGSIRFGIGRFTTEAEIEYAVGAVVEGVRGLRDGGGTGLQSGGARPILEPRAWA